jgi:uroporphyrinogen-III decarboxylase
MTSKERMKLAMLGEQHDRVPVMCQLSLGHIYLHTGMEPIRFWYTSEGLADAYIEMAEKYRFDGILISVSGRDPLIAEKIIDVAKIKEGHLITWESGYKEIIPHDDFPYIPGDMRKISKSLNIDEIDIDNLNIIESENELPAYFFDTLDRVLKLKGAELSIHGEIGTAFERFLNLFGNFESGLMALLDDPEKSHKIMDRMNKTVLVEALTQCKRGIDAMKLSSPFAGSGFISRKMYQEFVLPYEKEIKKTIYEGFGIPSYIHTCGAIGDRLDLITNTGTQGIECLDPYPLGDVDLEEAIEEIGSKVFIKGNLDSVNELQFKTVDEVKKIAKKRIEIGKKCEKGFILSSACSVAPGVSQEKIKVLYAAVNEYGRDG